MYQALYRKWRPMSFSDVIGQHYITDILRREVETGTVSHAYLFCGLRGTGKTTCAKILARAVNCDSPQNGEACGKCGMCEEAAKGTLIDIVEIDAASNNGVNNIRDIIDEVAYMPAQGKKKVYIIDEVHMLSPGAFNALLKTLEEPPEHVIFILCTTETHKVPATILSRCQRFDFGRISDEEISARLVFISEKEGLHLSDDAAMLIARLSEGAMRDALSLLELCVGHSGDIDYETACGILGVPGREHLFMFADFVAGRDERGALKLMCELLRTDKAATVCNELLSLYRDMLLTLCFSGGEKLAGVLPGDVPRMRARAESFGKNRILYIMTVLGDALDALPRPYTNERTCMEMAILRICAPECETGLAALCARVEALERRPAQYAAVQSVQPATVQPATVQPATEQPATVQPAPVQPATEQPAPEQSAPAQPAAEQPAPEQPQNGGESSGTPFVRYAEFIEEVGKRDNIARSFLVKAKGSFDEKTGILTITVSDFVGRNILSAAERQKTMAETLSQMLSRPSGVSINGAVPVKKSDLDEFDEH